MGGASTSLAAALLAAVVALAATPLAIRLAHRTGFLDRPRGYKAHGAPTPYLGGTAVFWTIALVALPLPGVAGRFAPVLACGAGLWALGTLDDRVNVSPLWRLLAEAAAAVVVWSAGLGWSVFGSAPLDLLLTMLWVIGLVNAFNLMDNLDGAAGSVAVACACGIGALALLDSEPAVASLSLVVAGACLGFLRWNLAKPARIFLGDGGSMPLGFLIACLAMAATQHGGGHGLALATAALLVGIPILDTSLVVFSRRRRGTPLWTGGRDHLTHRLLPRVRAAWSVAVVLFGIQAVVTVSAIYAHESAQVVVVVIAGAWGLLGLVAIWALDGGGRGAGEPAVEEHHHAVSSDPISPARPRPTIVVSEVRTRVPVGVRAEPMANSAPSEKEEI